MQGFKLFPKKKSQKYLSVQQNKLNLRKNLNHRNQKEMRK